MSQPSKEDKEQAILWHDRIAPANQLYENWKDRFKCDISEEYYEGIQWKNILNYEPYITNLIYSTLEIKLPTLTFDRPVALLKPKPSREGWNSDLAYKGAEQKQDVLNTFLLDPDNNVSEEVELAILDAFFRFGCLEVGFSADYISNPDADKPLLKSDKSPYKDKNGEVIKQPAEIPFTEQNYIKRVAAKTIRVGAVNHQKADRCSWVGYYEWFYIEDIIANKKLKGVDDIRWAEGRSSDFVDYDEMGNIKAGGDLMKVWKIWDLRRKEKLLIPESQDIILSREFFTRLPLFFLKFSHRTSGFYPLPPVSQWLMPQREINESREAMRIHRKRFVRKFFYNKSLLNDREELNKLEHGPDGTWIGVEGDPSTIASPVQPAQLDAAASQSMIVSKDDFNIVSGTSSEQRGEADRTTATQANIINQKSDIRDSRATRKIGAWLSGVFREILLQMKENNVFPLWVLRTTGNEEEIYEEIDTADLDDFDFEVTVDVSSSSPVALEQDKKSFMEFLAILNNYPIVSVSPGLVREVAYKCGYRNEKVIQQFGEMATLAAIAQLETAKAQVGALAQRQTAITQPNTQEQINNQMQNQVGLAQ